MNRIRFSSFALLTALAAGSVLAGPLNPPAGPIASTHKTLTEVEPRTAISLANTPGDNDSVFRITQPGSYYLTANIAGVTGKSGIEVAAANVTIDLNGFAIQGGMLGISAGGQNSLTVRNGTISGTTDTAIRAWNSIGDRIERVTIRGSGAGVGIDVGDAAIVDSCIVNQTSLGVRVDSNSLVKDTIVSNCTNSGYDAQGAKSVTFQSCTAASNGANGFTLVTSSCVRVEHCMVTDNGDWGIWATDDAVITDCTVTGSGSHGMSVGARCLVTKNLIKGNGIGNPGVEVGYGINISGSGTTVEGNRIQANTGYGISTQSGVIDCVIIGNWCRGNTNGPLSINAGNEVGPVITNPGSSSFSGATTFSNFNF